MLESWCFRISFESQRVHRSKTLLKPALQHFYPDFLLIQDKLSWERFLLVRPEILGVFGNTLTGDHIYFCHRLEKFAEHFQTLLSQQSKKVLQIFIAILQSTQNFVHFERKHHLHSLDILEFIVPEKCGYFNGRTLLIYKTLGE